MRAARVVAANAWCNRVRPSTMTLMNQAIVVDDDQVLARVMQRVLLRSGWAVHVASTPDEAMTVLGSVPLDVAVVDYDLAHQDGIALLRCFRNSQPNCVRILATARRDFPIDDLVNVTQVARVLRKPFGPQRLLEVVDDALAGALDTRRRALEANNAGWVAERAALDQFLAGGWLDLHLQPIVERGDDGSLRLVAQEALMRPRDPRFPTPLHVIAACERHERIGAMGSVVMHAVQRVIRAVPEPQKLFVNLHPSQLGEPDRLAMDLEPLRPFAHRIGLELTERMPIHEVAHWEQSVDLIQELGFSLVVDDLGAGANGLGMLADLQPAYVKLDMRLVQNVSRVVRKQRLVNVVAQLGDVLGYKVVAEGVEEEADAIALADCGVHWMQGWLFGRAVPVSVD